MSHDILRTACEQCLRYPTVPSEPNAPTPGNRYFSVAGGAHGRRETEGHRGLDKGSSEAKFRSQLLSLSTDSGVRTMEGLEDHGPHESGLLLKHLLQVLGEGALELCTAL